MTKNYKPGANGVYWKADKECWQGWIKRRHIS